MKIPLGSMLVFALSTLVLQATAQARQPNAQTGTVVVCRDSKPQPTFGFSLIELKCQDWASYHGGDFEPLKGCQVKMTRPNGTALIARAIAFTREERVHTSTRGIVTIIPQTSFDYPKQSNEHFGGFKLEYSMTSWPQAVVMTSCTPNPQDKASGFCSDRGAQGKRATLCQVSGN